MEVISGTWSATQPRAQVCVQFEKRKKNKEKHKIYRSQRLLEREIDIITKSITNSILCTLSGWVSWNNVSFICKSCLILCLSLWLSFSLSLSLSMFCVYANWRWTCIHVRCLLFQFIRDAFLTPSLPWCTPQPHSRIDKLWRWAALASSWILPINWYAMRWCQIRLFLPYFNVRVCVCVRVPVSIWCDFLWGNVQDEFIVDTLCAFVLFVWKFNNRKLKWNNSLNFVNLRKFKLNNIGNFWPFWWEVQIFD